MESGTVLISGGTKGIGKGSVQQLLKDGFHVATFSRNRNNCLQLIQELQRDHNDDVFFVSQADITDADSLRDFVSKAVQKFGSIDTLINNAGIGYYAKSDSFVEKRFQEMLQINLVGTALLSKAVIPYMKAKKSGLIINISSIAGRIALSHVEFYGATKFALMGYSQGIRNELKEHGIKVSTLCPGVVKTDFFEEEELERRVTLRKGKPLTMLEVNDIAKIISFICQQPRHCEIQDILVMPFE